MSYYRLYYFSDNNRICAFDEAECEDDQAAIRFAAERHAGRPAELWNLDRLVLRMDRVPGGASSAGAGVLFAAQA